MSSEKTRIADRVSGAIGKRHGTQAATLHQPQSATEFNLQITARIKYRRQPAHDGIGLRSEPPGSTLVPGQIARQSEFVRKLIGRTDCYRPGVLPEQCQSAGCHCLGRQWLRGGSVV